jgi:hypothetical protein
MATDKQSNLDNGLADAMQVGSRPHAAQEENTTASSSIGEDALARDLSSGVEGSVRSEPRQRRERTALTPREYSRGRLYGFYEFINVRRRIACY